MFVSFCLTLLCFVNFILILLQSGIDAAILNKPLEFGFSDMAYRHSKETNRQGKATVIQERRRTSLSSRNCRVAPVSSSSRQQYCYCSHHHSPPRRCVWSVSTQPHTRSRVSNAVVYIMTDDKSDVPLHPSELLSQKLFFMTEEKSLSKWPLNHASSSHSAL